MNQISSSKRLLLALTGLLGLLALTIGAAYVNLGPFNTVAAMSIALAKAAIIVVFFMEIRKRGPLIWVALATGFFWLAILFALSMSDFITRR